MARRVLTLALLWVVAALPLAAQTEEQPQIEPNQQAPSGVCTRTVFADVVALDQPYFWNRLGAVQPHGMLYALRRDVKAISGNNPGPGNARLRPEKRPRPIVLRVNEGDCLTIKFTNWLGNQPADNEQVRTREASVHVTGMQLVVNINDDGSWVGKNPGAIGSLAAPGQTQTYNFYAQKEGVYMLHNTGAMTTGEGDNGTMSAGLWGAVNVEPKGSVWYRSQVTEADLALATVDTRSLKRVDAEVGVSWEEFYPVIKYNMTHPASHPTRPNLPVLEMLAFPAVSAGAPAGSYELIYTDLTAIVQQNVAPTPIGVYPHRKEPFREFTIIFHDEPGAVQAFPPFYDRGLAPTLHSVRDAFAINYGTGGIGAEILANRLGVGPMYDCEACKYEEFFLSSWAVGDPAMVVDVPANAPCDDDPMDNWQGPGAYQTNTVSHYDEASEDDTWPGPVSPCTPTPGPKATIALYPDDPSNVYHSYLDDHVKFRNLHVGSDDHHIFHLHAHQWLHTPNEDTSVYKDSQAIGQGTGFTYEIAHEGSGNRNKTPGDSIFHCHFYPHFAQGMWGMWRVHDVLELGTPLGADGRPKAGERALPDGEIAAGTPIPALVPLPGEPMAPPPSVQVSIVNGQAQIALNQGEFAGNPGYPFYIPGLAGKRVPEPPLDVYEESPGVFHDGGLPRYLILNANIALEKHTRLDFTKDINKIDAIELAHHGEPWEQAAMRWHADLMDDDWDTGQNGFMSTFRPDGSLASTTAGHEVNGSDEIAGAPFADPCTRPQETGYPNAQFFRTYKGADIQMDVDFTSNGWHFPQQRFISLWEDVDDYFNGTRKPEPLFIRANTFDCVTYLMTNLVPAYYEMDDFQVRTPTDVLGQHIHLVKFDVTSSDGSANGFNYEDGTLSYEEVQHLIKGINEQGGILDPATGDREILTVKAHPKFPGFPGARTTVQRWYVDDVLNKAYDDNRSLRTVFTHDHFGPSTHQQAGLYAGLLTYKGTSANTTWRDGTSGQLLGNRSDGGPTTWNAVIRGPDAFREFALEFGDFQLAYWPNNIIPDPPNAINPPGRFQKWEDLQTHPWIYEKPALHGQCPNGAPLPCPEAISAEDPGFGVVNYRSEPIALRVTDNPQSNPTLAPAPRGDLSYAFSSDVHGDPYTPILRAYEQDEVRMRILVGAHEEEHNFSVHGGRWLMEPDSLNSGFKSSQMMGISEQHEFEIAHLLGEPNPDTGFVDFLYKAGSSNDDLWNGIWGLIRVYDDPRPDLTPISTTRAVPSNDVNVEANPDAPRPTLPSLQNEPTVEASNGGPTSQGAAGTAPPIPHASVCPPNSLPGQAYSLVAVAAAQALPNGVLTYNSRGSQLQQCTHNNAPYGQLDSISCSPTGFNGPLVDPTALMFVRQSDLDANDRLKPGAPIEPLILRARAGDCIKITLRNALPQGTYAADRLGYSLLPNILDKFNQNQVPPSAKVGLHPTLLSYDGLFGDGVTVGFNPDQNVSPGQSRTYVWYAGAVDVDAGGNVVGTPIEFGSVPIYSTDPIKHSNKGLVGAIIIEPPGAKWQEYPGQRAKAVVDPTPLNPSNGDAFREFVLIAQDDINLYMNNEEEGDLMPMRPLSVNEDPTETGQTAFNYRTEPVWYRQGFLPETPPTVTRNFQVADTFSNGLVGGDPLTPLFRAVKGDNVRFRLVHPGGDTQQHTWGVHGHIWQEQPWIQSSTRQGNNLTSEWKGVEYGLGPTGGFNALLQNGAGGAFQRTGDYMYQDYVPWYLSNGMWGILRVLGSRSALALEEPGWFLRQAPVEEPVPTEAPVSAPAATPGFDATVPQFEQSSLGAGK